MSCSPGQPLVSSEEPDAPNHFSRPRAVTCRPAVFLDRDGVLNANRPDCVRAWEEFVFMPRALEPLSLLARVNAPVVLVTDQSAISRGKVAAEIVDDIHRRMQTKI